MLAHFIDSKSFPCGYFDDRQSLFEEYLLEDISEIEFEYLLAHGMRHFGDYFFRPRCLSCYSCIPIRVRPSEFTLSRSQKRALKACRSVEVRIGRPKFFEEKFELYLKHKKKFPSLQHDVEDLENFRISFYDKPPFGVEFEYYLGGKLIGVALADCTRGTFSAIYTFYDPPQPKMSVGTFSVLKQLEFCKKRDIDFFYLGYFILHNKSLKYKASFKPNEIYIDNEWVPYSTSEGEVLVDEEKLSWKNEEFLVKPIPIHDAG